MSDYNIMINIGVTLGIEGINAVDGINITAQGVSVHLNHDEAKSLVKSLTGVLIPEYD